MDIKSVGLGFNHVQSTPVPEDPVQDQSSKPQVSEAQTAPKQPIETLSNPEKNSRIGQMKLEGSLQQANLNTVLDAQSKAAPPSAQDVTNPANGIVKNENPLPQVIENEFMDAVNDGIMRGRLKVLRDEFNNTLENIEKEQRMKDQIKEGVKKVTDGLIQQIG